MYVGNLSYDDSERDLRDLFDSHGEVTEVFMPIDRDYGRPKGFAFVTMASAESMEAAIAAVNGQEYLGRALVVNEARPQENSGGGFRGNGGQRAHSGKRNDYGYSRNRR